MTDTPFPPGRYPAVVIGSGPGGLQIAYLLGRRGIAVAHLTADPSPGGMFRRLPLFDRLLSWSKPAPPPADPGRGPEWSDWNLLVADPADRVSPRRFMEADSLFPTRDQMVTALEAFARRADLPLRRDTRWLGTQAHPEGGYVVTTSAGEYRTEIVVAATGMARPWRPPIPGVELALDYQSMGDPARFAGSTVLVVGKQNSGFEVAVALLPRAARVIVIGPGPTRFTVTTRSFAGARARFDGVYEDAVVGGGTLVLDGEVAGIRSEAGGLVVDLLLADGARSIRVDHVITATGFAADLSPLADLAPATRWHGRLPRVSDRWELEDHPGVFVAGTLTQSAPGPRHFGVPSTSFSIQGFRYNSVVLADEIAARLGRPRTPSRVEDPVGRLVGAISRSPALMSQKGYLVDVIRPGRTGWETGGLQPLTAFESGAGRALAAGVEAGPDGIQPAVYVRRGTGVERHLLPADPFLRFDGPEVQGQVRALLAREVAA